jgi:hypothetical protein
MNIWNDIDDDKFLKLLKILSLLNVEEVFDEFRKILFYILHNDETGPLKTRVDTIMFDLMYDIIVRNNCISTWKKYALFQDNFKDVKMFPESIIPDRSCHNFPDLINGGYVTEMLLRTFDGKLIAHRISGDIISFVMNFPVKNKILWFDYAIKQKILPKIKWYLEDIDEEIDGFAQQLDNLQLFIQLFSQMRNTLRKSKDKFEKMTGKWNYDKKDVDYVNFWK